eukprot:1034864-Rhodomonas_salina.1
MSRSVCKSERAREREAGREGALGSDVRREGGGRERGRERDGGREGDFRNSTAQASGIIDSHLLVPTLDSGNAEFRIVLGERRYLSQKRQP